MTDHARGIEAWYERKANRVRALHDELDRAIARLTVLETQGADTGEQEAEIARITRRYEIAAYTGD